MRPRSKALQLLRLARVQFIAGAALLFLMGALWAALNKGRLCVPRLLFGYLILMLANLSINYANDLFDVEADRFGRSSFISGGSGVLVAHPELRRLARWMALGSLALSLLAAALFTLFYAYPVSFFLSVLASNLLGWFYSAPPLSFSRRGLGEITTAFTLGWLIPGMGYWVVMGDLTRDFLLVTPLLTLYGLAFIILVEIPDLEGDRRGGKPTLVVRRGRPFAFRLTAALYALGTTYLFALAGLAGGRAEVEFRALGLLSLLPLAVALRAARRAPHQRGPATRLATAVLVTLMVFLVSLDAYLAQMVVARP